MLPDCLDNYPLLVMLLSFAGCALLALLDWLQRVWDNRPIPEKKVKIKWRKLKNGYSIRVR